VNPGQPPAVEPPGYVSQPGHVKTRPENNDHYVEGYFGHPWYSAIKAAHERITDMAPRYCIVKISTDLARNRVDFHYSLPEDLSPNELPAWAGGDVEKLREGIGRVIEQTLTLHADSGG
jgi:hypothetical protein